MLLAARDEGVRRVVFSSSTSVYGPSRDLPTARSAARPDLALRGREARRRALLHRLLARLRAFETVVAPLLQRLRPAPEPALPVRGGVPLFITAIAAASRSRSTATASSRATSPTSTTSSRPPSPRRPMRSPADVQRRLRRTDHPQPSTGGPESHVRHGCRGLLPRNASRRRQAFPRRHLPGAKAARLSAAGQVRGGFASHRGAPAGAGCFRLAGAALPDSFRRLFSRRASGRAYSLPSRAFGLENGILFGRSSGPAQGLRPETETGISWRRTSVRPASRNQLSTSGQSCFHWYLGAYQSKVSNTRHSGSGWVDTGNTGLGTCRRWFGRTGPAAPPLCRVAARSSSILVVHRR